MSTTGRGTTTTMTAEHLNRSHVGESLVSINGVHFARPVDDPMFAAHAATLHGLPIEGIDANFDPYGEGSDARYMLVTVWMGPAMVALNLNPSDVVVIAD
jgi:hypothetical protein